MDREEKIKEARDKMVAKYKKDLERDGVRTREAERIAVRAVDEGAEILERRRRGTLK